MNDEERLELLEEVLERLSAMTPDHVILIEGDKDIRALKKAGIHGDFFAIQSEGGPVRAAEYVYSKGKKAVILTDWDKRGERIAEAVAGQLSALSVRYDTSVRKDLSALSKKYIKDVESMDSMLARLYDMYGH